MPKFLNCSSLGTSILIFWTNKSLDNYFWIKYSRRCGVWLSFTNRKNLTQYHMLSNTACCEKWNPRFLSFFSLNISWLDWYFCMKFCMNILWEVDNRLREIEIQDGCQFQIFLSKSQFFSIGLGSKIKKWKKINSWILFLMSPLNSL